MDQSKRASDGALSRSATISISKPGAQVFAFISAGNTLPTWLKRCGPVRGAIGASAEEGSYNKPGARRIVQFDDGSQITEQLTEYLPPAYYSYSVTHITSVLRKITSMGIGQWWFTEKGNSTEVRWVYSFVPRNSWTRPLLSVFLTLFYKRFMEQSLRLAKTQLEQPIGSSAFVPA